MDLNRSNDRLINKLTGWLYLGSQRAAHRIKEGSSESEQPDGQTPRRPDMEPAGGSSLRPQRATRGAMAAAATAKAEAAAGGLGGGFGRELSLNVLQGQQEQALPLHKKGAAATAAAGTCKGAWATRVCDSQLSMGLIARSFN